MHDAFILIYDYHHNEPCTNLTTSVITRTLIYVNGTQAIQRLRNLVFHIYSLTNNVHLELEIVEKVNIIKSISGNEGFTMLTDSLSEFDSTICKNILCIVEEIHEIFREYNFFTRDQKN